MKLQVFACVAVLTLAGAGAANAAVTVIGDSMAEDCSQAAVHGKSDNQSIEMCNMALNDGMLDRKDRAGTLINRGVMRMRQHQWQSARADFDAAIQLEPKIGEGWVNRGAVLVGLRLFENGLSDINRGLELGVEEPAKAYYNRALAYEGLDNMKAAYLDYQQARAIKPNWELPQKELLRFTVTRR